VVGRVDKLVLPIIRQASEGDQLYGSVTARDIHEALAKAGVKVNRQQVLLERTIKAVGLHKVRVALHPEVIVEITANVGRSDAELEIQARGERPADVAARQAEQEEALAASEVFESGEAPPEIAGADAAEPEAAEAAAAEAPAERRRPARRPRE
jgi:large subunit ribosomal protein L9